MSEVPQSFGFSLFCDDIRQEIGGKLSIMGLYQSEMLFPAGLTFPIILPKFAIFVKYFEMVNLYTDSLTLRIFFPGDTDTPSFEQSVIRNEFSGFSQKYPVPADSDKLLSMNFPIILAPFVINQFGYIRVRLQRGDAELKFGSLLLRNVEENELDVSPIDITSPT